MTLKTRQQLGPLGTGPRLDGLRTDVDRRHATWFADRAVFARLHALDRDLLLHSLARLPQGSPDLSERSVTDRRFAAFLLSDHPATTFERCRRRAAYLDDATRRREVLHGWLAKLDATPPRPGETFDDSVRRLAATTRDLLDQQIIDVHGRKVVRVNDVEIESTPINGRVLLNVVSVDVGEQRVAVLEDDRGRRARPGAGRPRAGAPRPLPHPLPRPGRGPPADPTRAAPAGR